MPLRGEADEAVAAGLPPEDAPDAPSAYAAAMLRVAGRPTCLGCAHQGCAAEIGEPSHPVHVAARGVKERVLAALEARARAQGVPGPGGTAERVFLLLEGVRATARMFGPDAPLGRSEEALRRLIG